MGFDVQRKMFIGEDDDWSLVNFFDGEQSYQPTIDEEP